MESTEVSERAGCRESTEVAKRSRAICEHREKMSGNKVAPPGNLVMGDGGRYTSTAMYEVVTA
jgi:hypothetical protein